MHRNLDRRVETLVRIKDPLVQAQLTGLLDLAFAPDTTAWLLAPDGSWTRSPGPGLPQRDLQRELSRRPGEALSGA
jgi:polyphosphate kinase